jgi:plastocyanin
MRRRIVWSVVLVCGLVLAVSACGGLQKPVVLEAKNDYTVNMKLMDYTFEPNNLQVYQGATLVLKLENMSLKNHNFTIEDPEGNLMQGMDVIAKKTLETKIHFARPGIYKFYSNKFMDKMRGMKGQIIIIAR